MEDKVKIVAWKQIINEQGWPIYKLQLEGDMTAREKKKILKELKEWKEVAYGWNNNGKSELRLFSRPFRDRDSWTSWTKEFPYELTEINRNGKKTKINQEK